MSITNEDALSDRPDPSRALVWKWDGQEVFISLNVFANIFVRDVNTNISNDREFDELSEYVITFFKNGLFLRKFN